MSEAVGALAAPEVCDEVIRLALAKAGRAAMPASGGEVTSFVDGPLHLAAVELLGEESADAIARELAPIVRMMSSEISEVRPRTPVFGIELGKLREAEDPALPSLPVPSDPAALAPEDDDEDFPELTVEAPPTSDAAPRWLVSDPSHDALVGPTDGLELELSFEPPRRPRFSATRRAATAPAPENLPLLLLASADPASFESMGRALSGIATVDPVRDALAILEMVGADPSRLIVVDCAHPTVRLETLIALAPELPEGVRVVLWREQGIVDQSLAALGATLPSSWVCCGPDAVGEDVAAVCSVLLG